MGNNETFVKHRLEGAMVRGFGVVSLLALIAASCGGSTDYQPWQEDLGTDVEERLDASGDGGTGADLAWDAAGDIASVSCEADRYVVVESDLCRLCNKLGDGFVGDGIVVDDSNPCTDDFCHPNLGVTHEANNADCDDGDPVTVEDHCEGGQCVGLPVLCSPGDYYATAGLCNLCNGDGTGPEGQAQVVDDGDVCTDDICDEGLGVEHYLNGDDCDDGDPATMYDYCQQGQCTGTPIACPPGDFYATAGMCSLCNGDGTGTEGVAQVVDDGNVCTDDVCDGGLGVQHYFNGNDCDDGDPSTMYDYCQEDQCIGIAITCPAGDFYATAGLCSLCNSDGTGTEGLPQVVDDGNVCTDDVCDGGLGVQHYFNGNECDDGDPATLYDHCQGGECAGVPVACPAGDFYATAGMCSLCNGDGTGTEGVAQVVDDGNICTDDVCDEGLGVQHHFASKSCDDGDPETVNDFCQDGVCKGLETVCPAGDFYATAGMCSLCNGDGTGTVGDGSAVDDGDVCTDDVCDGGLGVQHYFNGNDCDDGDPATMYDHCQQGQCAGIPVVCPAGDFYATAGLCVLCNGDGTGTVGEGMAVDDGDVCTDDVCDGGLGVQHFFNGDDCDDGDPATMYDHCQQGQCAGIPVVCPAGDFYATAGLCVLCNGDGTGTVGEGMAVDDGDVCTDDVCDGGLGVQHFFNGDDCDDGDPATMYDHCQQGQCAGIPVVCPAGDFYATAGMCSLCNGDGTGTEGIPQVVDDGNVCTDDVCDPGAGVEHHQNWDDCDDGDPATLYDYCQQGQCAGIEVVCPAGDFFATAGMCSLCNGDGTGPKTDGEVIDDGNVCTDDACDPGGGVEHYFNGDDCDDGDPGTVQDICGEGVCAGEAMLCVPGKWEYDGDWWCILCDVSGMYYANDGVDVDDEEDCTEDVCDPVAGVVHTPIVGDCWDDDECTLDDVCVNGACVGTPLDCDDGVAHTPDDVCIEGSCIPTLDADGDGVPNYGIGPKCDGPALLEGCLDNCPYRANPDQVDANNDGVGDACTTVRWWMKIDTTEKVVALTFDDGWSSTAFENILTVLEQEKAYATFFFAGLYIEDSTIGGTELMAAAEYGHALGNHTFNHTLGKSLEETVQEVELCDAAYVEAGVGSVRPLFRPAGTDIILWINLALEQTGYTEALFANFDPADWTDPEPAGDAMVACIVEQVEPGDIIDFHVGPKVTADYLAQIIQGLKAKGYEFLTVEQMLKFGDPVLVPIDQVRDCNGYYGL